MHAGPAPASRFTRLAPVLAPARHRRAGGAALLAGGLVIAVLAAVLAAAVTQPGRRRVFVVTAVPRSPAVDTKNIINNMVTKRFCLRS
jgi:hypothetical protein